MNSFLTNSFHSLRSLRTTNIGFVIKLKSFSKNSSNHFFFAYKKLMILKKVITFCRTLNLHQQMTAESNFENFCYFHRKREKKLKKLNTRHFKRLPFVWMANSKFFRGNLFSSASSLF